jgi:hypothetical protein
MTKWVYEVGWDSCFNAFEYVKDEHNFFIIAIMKIKLCNELRQHLNTIICMFVQEFFTHENFPYHMATISWRDQKMQIGATNWDHMSIGFLCHGLFVSMMWTCMMIMFVCPLDFLWMVFLFPWCEHAWWLCLYVHWIFYVMVFLFLWCEHAWWLCLYVHWIFYGWSFCFHDVNMHDDYVYFIMSFTNIWVWWLGLWVALGKI